MGGLVWRLCISYIYLIVLQLEDKPKDVKPDLRRESDTHWNWILPQIYIIKSSVVKFKTEDYAHEINK